MMGALGNHLWQSTLFTVGIACLALIFRRKPAIVRYWLWLIASIKFLVPFAALVAVGTRLHYASPDPPLGLARLVVASSVALQVSEPFLETCLRSAAGRVTSMTFATQYLRSGVPESS